MRKCHHLRPNFVSILSMLTCDGMRLLQAATQTELVPNVSDGLASTSLVGVSPNRFCIEQNLSDD